MCDKQFVTTNRFVLIRYKFLSKTNLFSKMEMFVCSQCLKELPRKEFHEFCALGRKRPVTSKCKGCRKEEYYLKRYDMVCICCLKHRPLNSNTQCKDCNEASGLRECKRCAEILPLFLSFYGGQRLCKNCKKTVDKGDWTG